MEEVNSFVFYRSFFEALNDLKKEDRLAIYDAICDLALNGNERDLSGISKTIFTLIKPQVIANREKQKNGSKGGRPKKETIGSENKKTIGFSKTKTTGYENKKPNVNVNDNANKNDNENVNNNDNVNENDFAVVVDAYEKNIGLITPHIAELLRDYLQELPEDLIVLAIQKADEAGKRSFSYMQGILENWVKSGIKTLQDVKKQDEEFRNRKVLKSNAEKDNKKAPCAKGISPYEQRTYENLDFLYANRTKKESDTDDNDANSTNEL